MAETTLIITGGPAETRPVLRTLIVRLDEKLRPEPGSQESPNTGWLWDCAARGEGDHC